MNPTPAQHGAHTPGPWSIFDLRHHTEDGVHGIYGQNEGVLIAKTEKWKGLLPEEESEANARLIATAPELLAALERLVEIERRDNLTDPDLCATDAGREHAWSAARAAIAKAGGSK